MYLELEDGEIIQTTVDLREFAKIAKKIMIIELMSLTFLKLQI